MGVKLQSALGGSVELNAPSTASNFSMTVPAGNGTVATTDQLQNFRNKVHNGNFMIWQRGTSTTDTNAFIADRWGPIINGSGGTTTRSRDSTNLPPDNRVKYKISTVQSVASRTGVTAIGHRQTYEIGDIMDMFYGGQYTVSFWYRSNITGNHYVRVGNDQGTGQVGGNQPTVPFAYNTSGVWQYTTVTITLPALTTMPTAAENTIGGFLDIGPTLGGSGPSTITSGQYFDLALVQLERGSVATTFEMRPTQVELAICQRYFCSSFNWGNGIGEGGNDNRGAIATAYNNTQLQTSPIPFPVAMRAAPTMSYYRTVSANAGKWTYYPGGWFDATPGGANVKPNSVEIQFSVVDARPTGACYIMSGNWAANAEL